MGPSAAASRSKAPPSTAAGGAGGAAAELAIVLVHYHAPGSLRDAVAALRADLEASSLRAEWVLVDNGSSAQERDQLAALGLPLLPGAGNRGFAAGVNVGVAASAAPWILVLNPDVEVLPGCLAALVGELARGAGAAAPVLYWDRGRRFLLPPGEERSRRAELLALLGRRFRSWEARARRRWRHDARRHWLASKPVESVRLSGAALALSRAAWGRVGPFDEGFRLYFEETDWLLRLRAEGIPARQVAAAAAVHGFAHSTRHEPRSVEWFAASSRRFAERHYGRWFVTLSEVLARALGGAAEAPLAAPWAEGALAALRGGVEPGGSLWLELSPNRRGYPAAAERVERDTLPSWSPPWELMRASGLAGMSLCAVDDHGRERGRWWIELREAGTSSG